MMIIPRLLPNVRSLNSGLAVLFLLISGCAAPTPLTLMPTPVIYYDSQVDPFKHLKPAQKKITDQVYFATNRASLRRDGILAYGNTLESKIHLGKATVRMGAPGAHWEDLRKASLSQNQSEPIPIILEQINEQTVLPEDDLTAHYKLTPEQIAFFDSINADLAEANDKELMVYVHGTKVDFANSTILTAEIDHFAGRDFVSVAFAWPSHQNIFHYLIGTDVRRAQESSSALKSLLILLSEHTSAEQINVLSYSAGARVTSKALFELRQLYGMLEQAELKEELRIGSVVFAAADVELDVFLQRIVPISEIAQQVVITVSDDDNALLAAYKFMGGSDRVGSSEAEDAEETYIVEKELSNVEIIDVSIGQKIRGFDIVGHHYWYRHPWMSSDIIFLMRTDLPPSRRGLSATEREGIWYLSPDYPEKIRLSAEIELKGHW
jgi:esterase/lipase superfamily enzyme